MTQINGKVVSDIGYGMMGLSWRNEILSTPEAVEVCKAALEAGSNFFDGGDNYGTPQYNSLHILNAYFTKYPEDVDKIVVSIKSGGKVDVKGATIGIDGSLENLTQCVENMNKILQGKKVIEVFQMGRVDISRPIEEAVGALKTLLDAGKIGGIGLSEVSASTIRRAAKIAKISAVEVEFSLFETTILQNGVAEACAELDIPIIAYSPLGRGFLTGRIKTYDDVPERLKSFPRFFEENFENNLKLGQGVEAIAEKKGVTPAQVALAWVLSHNGKPGLPKIVAIPGATTSGRILENTTRVELSDDELKDINRLLETCIPQGGRYPAYAVPYEWA